MVLSLISRVSCKFSNCFFQSKNIISWYPFLFFVSAFVSAGGSLSGGGIQFVCSSWAKKNDYFEIEKWWYGVVQ